MVDAAMLPPALPLLLLLLRLRQRQRKNWAGPQFTACVLTFLQVRGDSYRMVEIGSTPEWLGPVAGPGPGA